MEIPLRYNDDATLELVTFSGDGAADRGVAFSINGVLLHADEVFVRYSPRPRLVIMRDGMNVTSEYVPRWILRRIAVEVGRYEGPSNVTERGR
jgi:hypothetical protein